MRIPIVVLITALVLILGASAQSTTTGPLTTGAHGYWPLVAPTAFTRPRAAVGSGSAIKSLIAGGWPRPRHAEMPAGR
jgi:hypothetical protein